LQITLGARARSERVGNGFLVQRFGGALDLGASLFELLAGFRHAGLVLGLVHPLAQFIDIGQHFLFFLAKPFEPPLDFLAFLVRLGFLQGGLQFLKALVEILLALGEFLQTIQDLELLVLFGSLLGSSLALVLVFVFGLFEVQLVKLALVLLLGLALPALALVAAAGNLVFVGGELEQGLVSGLLGGQGRFEFLGGFLSVVKQFKRFLDFLLYGLGEIFGLGVGGALSEGLRLIERVLFGLADDGEVFLELGGAIGFGIRGRWAKAGPLGAKGGEEQCQQQRGNGAQVFYLRVDVGAARKQNTCAPASGGVR